VNLSCTGFRRSSQWLASPLSCVADSILPPALHDFETDTAKAHVAIKQIAASGRSAEAPSMSQPQPPMPHQRATISPPQPSPSPTLSMPPYQAPPTTIRPIMSPTPSSQPASPYAAAYAQQTSGNSTPVVSAGGQSSPSLQQQHVGSQVQHGMHTPSFPGSQQYQPNGRTASYSYPPPNASPSPGLPGPHSQPLTAPYQPPSQNAVPISSQNPPVYSNGTFAHIPPHMGPGTMGPPAPAYPMNELTRQGTLKQPSAKSYTYDMDDTLAGTGINLEEEEQFMNEAAGLPGDADALYGAGPLNRPAEHIKAETQEELAAKVAEAAWRDSAHRLAVSRAKIQEDWFIKPGWLHKRMHDVAGDYNLDLNLDLKAQQQVGRIFQPLKQEKAEIRVKTDRLPNGTLVQTYGSFVPTDAYLIDQLGLLSLASKEYLGRLVGDADEAAINRQQSAHGAIPPEWADAAASQVTAANESSAMEVDSAASK
jgi:hypothetical protein